MHVAADYTRAPPHAAPPACSLWTGQKKWMEGHSHTTIVLFGYLSSLIYDTRRALSLQTRRERRDLAHTPPMCFSSRKTKNSGQNSWHLRAKVKPGACTLLLAVASLFISNTAALESVVGSNPLTRDPSLKWHSGSAYLPQVSPSTYLSTIKKAMDKHLAELRHDCLGFEPDPSGS